MLSKGLPPALARALFFLLPAILALRVLSHAWVSDDAYITFRVVDNAINGLGLTWNPGQRVQVYTHPLWMLLHLPLYALTGNIYVSTLALSLCCFAAACALAFRAQPARTPATALALFVPLAACAPIVDFATSGLENPLSMLLIAAFACYLRPAPNYNYTALATLTALMLLTRLDLGLIPAPFWLWQLSTRRIPLKSLLPGFALLAFWFAFSLLYYGFIFPNTKYAKLNTGLPVASLLRQGLYYLQDLCIRDLPSPLILAFSLIAAARRRPLPHSLLALGSGLYMAYVIVIGGDFMSGRFWAVPLFTCILLLPRNLPATCFATLRSTAVWLLFFSILALCPTPQRTALLSGCLTRVPPLTAENPIPANVCNLSGIYDERSYYENVSALFPPGSWQPRSVIGGYWQDLGLALKAVPSTTPQLISASGMEAFLAGPHNIFIDKYAITSPLLARLPMKSGDWRIGHFTRDIPEGYPQSLKNGDTSGMERDLGEYAAALSTITAAPLFSLARLKTILAFNTGQYENLRNAYITRHCAEFFEACH